DARWRGDAVARIQRVNKGGIGDDDLANGRTVNQQRALNRPVIKMVIEQPCSGPQNGLALPRRISDGGARRKVIAVAHLCLPVVTQPKCQVQIRPQLHRVFKKAIGLGLREGGLWIASGDLKERGTACGEIVKGRKGKGATEIRRVCKGVKSRFHSAAKLE